MLKWVYLLVAVSAEVGATSALKASERFTRLTPSLLVLLGYGVAFYFLSLTMETIPVGISYALWSGIGIILISLIGWHFFDQRLDAPALVGIALILSGVAVINLWSKTAVH